MKRRELVTTLGALTALGLGKKASSFPFEMGRVEVTGGKGPADWPFPSSTSRHQWTKIDADGFSFPITGYVFEGTQLQGGMPLGALGTGYMTLEGDGRLGFCSIFNDLVPPKKVFADWLTVESGTRSVPLSSARIAYWGHYPVADLRALFAELPLELGIRAFTPFIPGDAAVSNTPVTLFEMAVRNVSDESLPLTLLMRFPAAPKGSSMAVRGEGIVERSGEEGVYSLAANVPARESRRVRFAVAWYAPSWRDSGGEPHLNRYSQRFRDAAEVAEFGLRRQSEHLRRVHAWQAEIHRSDLPEWLKDALVQSFYSFAKNSVWIARTRKDEWWSEDGWFTHSESHTGCPIVETMVCRMHGHFPLLFFFPELEVTTLEAFRHFQISDGEIPFCFGMPTSMRDPRYHCQHPLNSGQYAQMVYRLYLRTGDRELLARFYDSAKRAIRYQYSLDDDGCGLVHDQSHARPGEPWPANQFYDVWPWEGTSSYVAGTWLATLAAGRALASAVGDGGFQTECSDRLVKAQRVFEENLWNGSYYRLWNDRQKQRVSDICLANQLMAQWCVRVLGLGDVLPADHVAASLDTIARLNMHATSYGLINGVTSDGKPFDTKLLPSGDHAKNIFVGENLCAAMTFMYHGRRDIGLEIAHRLYEAMAVKTRSPWNQRCLLNGEMGLPQWGDDYYSNLIFWAVPMALRGQAIGDFSLTGLPKSLITAARA
ncbi:MAG: hypothetical protein LAP13_12815 [Acidobacteriia bacterium]|nr:hypothetical protein [Terriglobia bacterium]